jgi:hypothetical protein
VHASMMKRRPPRLIALLIVNHQLYADSVHIHVSEACEAPARVTVTIHQPLSEPAVTVVARWLPVGAPAGPAAELSKKSTCKPKVRPWRCHRWHQVCAHNSGFTGGALHAADQGPPPNIAWLHRVAQNKACSWHRDAYSALCIICALERHGQDRTSATAALRSSAGEVCCATMSRCYLPAAALLPHCTAGGCATLQAQPEQSR